MATISQLEAALRRYEPYTEADPDNHLLWLELGDAYHRLSRFDQALASFQKALAISPGLPTARSRMAMVRISQHRFDEAERELRQLVDEGHDVPAILHNLGLALYYQERWRDAQPYFSAADTAGLKAPSNLAYMARCLHHAGEMEQAIAACQRWAAAANDASSFGYLALLEMDNGNMKQAAALAERSLRDDPGNTDAALVLGTAAMEQQDAAAASSHFNAVLQKQPDSGRAWLGFGLTHLYNQNTAQGIEALNKAKQLMPGNSGTIVALGWTRLSQQDAVGAEQEFRQAIEVDRGFAEAHGARAAALLFQRRFEEAKQAMEVSFRLDRKNFGGLYARSILLKLEGKSDLATRLLATALDQTPPGGDRPLVGYIQAFARQRKS
jgi:tetratricopeptide (TPR) repeat protein